MVDIDCGLEHSIATMKLQDEFVYCFTGNFSGKNLIGQKFESFTISRLDNSSSSKCFSFASGYWNFVTAVTSSN